MPRTIAAAGLTAALFSCAAPPTAAADLFSITAVGNGVNTVTATGADVLDLSEAAIETFGPFGGLSGQNVVATLNYAGVANAASFSINAAETSATLTFPITGFSRTFTGTDADDLADQINDFVLEDGADAYADFLKAIREQSVAAVLDGNPGATTARLARHTFDLYGLGVSGPAWANPNRVVVYEEDDYAYVNDAEGDPAHYDRRLDGPAHHATNPVAWFEVTPTYESNEAGPFDGDTAAVHFAGGFFFNEHLGVSAGGNFAYTDLEGTDIFHSGGHVALNWNVVPTSDWGGTSDDGRSNSVAWQLSPFVHSGVGVSGDAAAGGAFVGVGLASNVHVGLRDAVVFNWGSQIFFADGVDLSFEDDDDDGDDDDVEFETDLGQSIVSTGLLVTVFLDRPDGNFFLDGGVSYSAFLDDAAVDYWVAPEVGLGYRFNRDSRLRLTYRPLLGNAGYEAHTAGVNLVFAF